MIRMYLCMLSTPAKLDLYTYTKVSLKTPNSTYWYVYIENMGAKVTDHVPGKKNVTYNSKCTNANNFD